MVLTNTLPGQGTASVIPSSFMPATSTGTCRSDRWALRCGARTLNCANASATRPFGTIDTPTQGGVASATAYVNFGWALTPAPKQIPIDGSTVTVWVDGLPLGAVDYNHERGDIETLFPDYQNTIGSNGPVGFRVIDTTTLTDGLHTIVWTVTDDAGTGEGLGSRFFTVANGVGAATRSPPRRRPRPCPCRGHGRPSTTHRSTVRRSSSGGVGWRVTWRVGGAPGIRTPRPPQ